jgi:small subunit ribosomal protein S7
MSRRHAQKNASQPGSEVRRSGSVTKFMNAIMIDGKKSVAERIVYGAFDRSKTRQADPVEVFHQALDNVRRTLKSARAALVVPPTRCRSKCARAPSGAGHPLADRRCRGRNENTMVERLSGELMDAANNRGTAVKKREDTHKMADANRAFSHYRW